jgi:N4-gp56 family major capsid protein
MKVYYDRRLLERALPMLLHNKFGQKRGIPMHGGKTIEFRKFATLGTATTPLTEGTPPASQALSVSNITATVEQFGGVVNFSDLVATTTIDPLLEEITDLLAEQAAETIDELIRNELILGTNVLYGGTSNTQTSDVAAGDDMTVDLIRQAVLTLETNRAKRIDGKYHAIISPEVAFDIVGTDEWVAAQQYAGSQRIFDGAIGELYGVRFWVTDKAYSAADGTSSAVVWRSLFFGANAFGVVDLAGHNLQTVFKPLGSAGTADPLNQQGTMGWKISFTTRILDDANMVRVETTASQA